MYCTLRLRVDGFNAPKSLLAMPAYSLDGSMYSHHANQNVSNSNLLITHHFFPPGGTSVPNNYFVAMLYQYSPHDDVWNTVRTFNYERKTLISCVTNCYRTRGNGGKEALFGMLVIIASSTVIPCEYWTIYFER